LNEKTIRQDTGFFASQLIPTPWQGSSEPQYAPDEALTRGTLFPGLDLPFMNMGNRGNPYEGTPLGELMAIGFAAHELVLYLDTHKDDAEAFMMLKKLLALKREAHDRYVERYGPLHTDDLMMSGDYDWVKSPWPWQAGEGGMK
jgi:spore coat protein JB